MKIMNQWSGEIQEEVADLEAAEIIEEWNMMTSDEIAEVFPNFDREKYIDHTSELDDLVESAEFAPARGNLTRKWHRNFCGYRAHALVVKENEVGGYDTCATSTRNRTCCGLIRRIETRDDSEI